MLPSHAMKMTRSLVFILVLMACSITVSAQTTPWTLEKCVHYALENNLTIREQILNQERLGLSLHQSKMMQYPTLNSSASHNYNFGRTIDPFTNSYVNQRIQSNSFSLSSGVTLYNGFRIRRSIEKGVNDIEVNGYRTEVIRNQISLAVVEAYLQVVFADKQLKIVQQQAASTQAQLERAKAMVDAGRSNKTEYLSLKAQSARDKWTIQQAEGNIRLAYVNLMQLMQYSETDSFEIVIPDLTTAQTQPLSQLDEIITSGMKTMPDIKVVETQLKSDALSIQIAEAAIQPRLSAFGTISTLFSESRQETYNPQTTTIPIGYVDGTLQPVFTQVTTYDRKTTPFGSQLSDNFGQAVGLQLSIPIFNNHQVKTQIEQAKLNLAQSEIDLERSKNQVRSDIIQSYTEYQNALASYNAAVEEELAQRENYLFAQERFEAGLLTSLELITFKTNWVNSQTEVERSRFDLIFTNTQVMLYQRGTIMLPSN